MAITIKDIALRAGVSSAAVSFVLHGSKGTIRVSKEKAELIRRAAEELNYVPNQNARTLKQGVAKNIGLVFENFSNIAAGPLYHSQLLDGITSVLFEHNFRLTLLPDFDADSAATELNDGQLGGIIWCKAADYQAIKRLTAQSRLPVVALNSSSSSEFSDIHVIRCDNELGSKLVVDHLVSNGHRRIAFVREIGEERTPDAVARFHGFLAAMEQRGLPVESDQILNWSRDAVEIVQWWESKPDITAIYCWNEGHAGSVLRRAFNAGIRVPEMLSVVGFDSTPYCETTHPPLTSASQPIHDMAKAAAVRILHLINGKENLSPLVVFPCSLDERGSTKKLAQSGVSIP